MIILTAAALAAAQPAPAPQAPVAHPAGHAAGHGEHAQQQGQHCPCCAQNGSNQDRNCCAGHRQEQHRDHGASR